MSNGGNGIQGDAALTNNTRQMFSAVAIAVDLTACTFSKFSASYNSATNCLSAEPVSTLPKSKEDILIGMKKGLKLINFQEGNIHFTCSFHLWSYANEIATFH